MSVCFIGLNKNLTFVRKKRYNKKVGTVIRTSETNAHKKLG